MVESLLFTVVAFTSEDRSNGRSADALSLIHLTGQDTGGWQSEALCSFPQELVLQVEARCCDIEEVRLYPHPDCCPSEVEVWVSNDFVAPADCYDSPFEMLGSACFDQDNKCGVVKSFAMGTYVKMVVLGRRKRDGETDSANAGRVGLRAVEVWGRRPKRTQQSSGATERRKLDGSGSFDNLWMSESAVRDALLDAGIPLELLPDCEGLPLQMLDKSSRDLLLELREQKDAAVAAEKFAEAQQLQDGIDSVTHVGSLLKTYEKTKSRLLSEERYSSAKSLTADVMAPLEQERLRVACMFNTRWFEQVITIETLSPAAWTQRELERQKKDREKVQAARDAKREYEAKYKSEKGKAGQLNEEVQELKRQNETLQRDMEHYREEISRFQRESATLTERQRRIEQEEAKRIAEEQRALEAVRAEAIREAEEAKQQALERVEPPLAEAETLMSSRGPSPDLKERPQTPEKRKAQPYLTDMTPQEIFFAEKYHQSYNQEFQIPGDTDGSLEETFSQPVVDFFGRVCCYLLCAPDWRRKEFTLAVLAESWTDFVSLFEIGQQGGSAKGTDTLYSPAPYTMWKHLCKLVEYGLLVKFVQVQLASLHLIATVFDFFILRLTKPHLNSGLKDIVGLIVAKLGDTNMRLHQASESLVPTIANKAGASHLITHLVNPPVVVMKDTVRSLDSADGTTPRRRGSSGKKGLKEMTLSQLHWKALTARLASARTVVQTCGRPCFDSTKSYSVPSIIPLVIDGLHHAHKEVRHAAIELAALLFLFAGEDLLPFLHGAGLPDNVTRLLNERFHEISDEDVPLPRDGGHPEESGEGNDSAWWNRRHDSARASRKSLTPSR
ncbi:unnamed protein product [Vitrella brassicaformis CCMP3155]|uniref:Centrosomal protein CEP104 N-terminal domain-containing protein n=1 Tax=Vitrella brassicaformis (strain CCMP3155) TaxID=1169540 RepID=A0A0G4FJ28_VITBC|nr:unnamed protein product [Vitrella brassicaformis CCMP3155]|eukprot:CEM13775.1 unnamed protein product [Vitrella brassicaformis CCMP3155]